MTNVVPTSRQTGRPARLSDDQPRAFGVRQAAPGRVLRSRSAPGADEFQRRESKRLLAVPGKCMYKYVRLYTLRGAHTS
jgi:hypothetical protein